MRLIVDLEAQEPTFGVALDEALLERVRAGGEDILRFWVNARAAVIGRSQYLDDEIDRAAAERHGFTIVRRMSGGGAVLHYPGNLNLSLIMADASRIGPVEEAFDRVGAAIIGGLTSLGIETRASSHALFSGSAKISGAAQARRGGCVLYHATLLVKAWPVPMQEILRAMQDRYHARGVASRPQPVTSLDKAGDRPVDLAEVAAAVAGSFRDWLGIEYAHGRISDSERDRAEALVASRYGRWEWTASR